MGLRVVTLVDTDILTDAARGIQEAIDYLANLAANDVPAISAITEMELIVGCRNKTELRDLTQFLQQFQIIPLDAAIGDKSTELLRDYRLSHGLLIPDSPIAATAMVAGIAFVSKNQRDTKFIVGLNLLAYP